jgi:hypothetical protein
MNEAEGAPALRLNYVEIENEMIYIEIRAPTRRVAPSV